MDDVNTLHEVVPGSTYPKHGGNMCGGGHDKSDDKGGRKDGKEGEEEGGGEEGGFDEGTFHDWYLLLPQLASKNRWRFFSWFLELDCLGCFTIDDVWKNRVALWRSQKEFFMLMAYLQAHRQARVHVRHYFGKTGVASKLGEFRMKHHHKGLGNKLDRDLQDEEKAVKIVIAASKTASEKARSRLFSRYLRSFLSMGSEGDEGDKEDAELTKGLMTRLIVVTTIRSKLHHVHKLLEEGLLTPVQAGSLMHKFGDDLATADTRYHDHQTKSVKQKTRRQISQRAHGDSRWSFTGAKGSPTTSRKGNGGDGRDDGDDEGGGGGGGGRGRDGDRNGDSSGDVRVEIDGVRSERAWSGNPVNHLTKKDFDGPAASVLRQATKGDAGAASTLVMRHDGDNIMVDL